MNLLQAFVVRALIITGLHVVYSLQCQTCLCLKLQRWQTAVAAWQPQPVLLHLLTLKTQIQTQKLAALFWVFIFTVSAAAPLPASL